MAKNKKKRFLGVGIGVIAAIGLFTIAILLAVAASDSGSGVIDRNAEGNGGEVTIAASAVTQSINYQGRLTDSAGNPLRGTYIMTFKLFGVTSGGTALDTDMHKVEVVDGLFNTSIDFDQSYFDGRALWLGITVGADSEMTPRQELRPVPYALSLRPGAVINGSLQGYVLEVKNTRGFLGNGVRVHTTGRSSGGVYAETSGDRSKGVVAATSGNHSVGVYARTYGYDSDGVYAKTSGNRSDGVYAETSGRTSYGVRASTSGRNSEGVYVLTSGEFSEGVYAHTSGDSSKGVYAFTSGDNSHGVWISTSGIGSDGVRAYSANRYGVYGKGEYGGYFTTNQDEGTGIYAHGGSSGYAAVFRGNVKITSQSSGATIMELGEGLDYAEGFDVSDPDMIVPGSVLIIDPDNPGKLTLSNTPYDIKVAGIVAGANETGSGVRLGTDQFDYDVALAGRVYCNVDATGEGVEPGDMLTTSATPGYAMKSTDYMRAQGAILGKAMQRLEKGEKGQILVLVTLQ